jgi:hypothetical protein
MGPEAIAPKNALPCGETRQSAGCTTNTGALVAVNRKVNGWFQEPATRIWKVAPAVAGKVAYRPRGASKVVYVISVKFVRAEPE